MKPEHMTLHIIQQEILARWNFTGKIMTSDETWTYDITHHTARNTGST